MESPASLSSYLWLTSGLPRDRILRDFSCSSRKSAEYSWASFALKPQKFWQTWEMLPLMQSSPQHLHFSALCSVEQEVPRNLSKGNENPLETYFSSQLFLLEYCLVTLAETRKSKFCLWQTPSQSAKGLARQNYRLKGQPYNWKRSVNSVGETTSSACNRNSYRHIHQL